MSEEKLNRVLVIGGTGHLGGKVVSALLDRGKRVRALVRAGSDASALEKLGVEIAQGDMMDPPSLNLAMEGMDVLIATAAGYMRRRKTDTSEIDRTGNFNLVDAAQNTGLRRFVLTSILNCDQASYVPHFWNKKLVEDYLEERHVPFVSLRPGAFIDQGSDYLADGARKGNVPAMIDPNIRYTRVLTEDVARYLAMAVDAPEAVSKRIDIGYDRPVSEAEIAGILSDLLGRKIRVQAMPWWIVNAGLGVGGLFAERARDFRSMLRYTRTGQYVADTTLQAKLFGDVPRIEDGIRRWLIGLGMLETGHEAPR
ncbi:MAG: SDR family oxidoreductase [Chloroflexota bacterium]